MVRLAPLKAQFVFVVAAVYNDYRLVFTALVEANAAAEIVYGHCDQR